MAETKNLSQQLGASPKKLALIGVLAVVLAGVLYAQFGPALLGGDEPSDEVAQASRRPKRLSAKSESKSDESDVKADSKAEFLLVPVERRHWPAPPLADVIRYDPFAVPAAFPQTTVPGVVGGRTSVDGVEVADVDNREIERANALAAAQAKLQELQQRGVRVIVQGRKQAAVIGDRTVHVGDDVDGFTVTAIKSDGVVVERKLD